MKTIISVLIIAQVVSMAYGCQTVAGDNCIFPTTYREKTLNKCVKYDWSKYWCATSNNDDGTVKTYGECKSDCPKEVHDPTQECITTGNFKCTFPFDYDGVTYNKCTDVANNGTKWCALNKWPGTTQAYHFEACDMTSQCK